MDLQQWGICIAGAAVILVVSELRKVFLRRSLDEVSS
jgi:hypothetical protein